MNNKTKDIKEVVAKMNFKVCGTVTCIHNIDGKCCQKNCELYERMLKQED